MNHVLQVGKVVNYQNVCDILYEYFEITFVYSSKKAIKSFVIHCMSQTLSNH